MERTIKAIGFNYGGVIADSQIKFGEAYAKTAGVSLEEWQAVYFKYNRKINIESLSNEEVYGAVLKDLGKEDRLGAVLEFAASRPAEKIDERMLGLTDTLRARGYKVGLLSNTTKDGGAHIRKMGMEKHFDALMISAEIGFQKPEKEAYEIFAHALGVAPSEMAYIDDSERSLLTAHEIGFTPILFTTYEDLLEQLRQLGV